MTPPLISIYEQAGSFAENKDVAKQLREEIIMPTLKRGDTVIIDFAKVSGVTQSFIHALVSGPIRQLHAVALEGLLFKNCNAEVQAIIRIVFAYLQESMNDIED